MDFYTENTDVNVVFELVKDGVPYDPDKLRYRVTDEDELPVVAWTNLSLGAVDEGRAALTIPASLNQIATDATKGLRTIYLEVTASDVFSAPQVIEVSYVLTKSAQLEVMVNSFQPYAEAMMNASSMPNLTSWAAASKQDRIAALGIAFFNLCKLRYAIGTQPDDWQSRLFTNWTINDMLGLDASDFNGLDSRFVEAIKYAQIAEANVMLQGDPVAQAREDGLMSETIGESSRMFRPGKPLQMPISLQALRYLERYVRFNPTLTRA